MAKTLFSNTQWELQHVLFEIDRGRFGLPDIQRPFVWKNSKVRDLFDSMMKGYPIGYFILWESGLAESNKQIGLKTHDDDYPSTLIIDGQQRLTSLYTVMRGVPILDNKFQEKRIKIAFHLIDRKFEVSSAAHKRSPEWIEDISIVFQHSNNLWRVEEQIIERLEESRARSGSELSDEEKDEIYNNIRMLLRLIDYPIPTITIGQDTDEESVADIFVRVNSGGVKLNETDFILTLLSLVNNDLRKQIEKFCEKALKPTKSGSPYNQLFEPKPHQIIRTVMAYGFDRARLKYAYMLLRGKNFETEKYDKELQEEYFNTLEIKLNDVLSLDNWHEFINCIRAAGYISDELILAENNMVYTYVMYLIGKKRFGIKDQRVLRKYISRWYYMVSVSAYYSSSTESTVQSDLNELKTFNSEKDFLEFIDIKIGQVFTDDYFEITLPSRMNTSSTNSPAWKAYCAAQVLLETKALFSTVSIGSLFGPGGSGKKKSVEKHHLFPKAFLTSQGYGTDVMRNQIANFEYIEWGDNNTISDKSPEVYWTEMIGNKTPEEIKQIRTKHALPENWEEMDYEQFLEERRSLMAKVIREGYDILL